LTSILGYYAYIILSIDRDSFADKGGDVYAHANQSWGLYLQEVYLMEMIMVSAANKAGLNKSVLFY
jgi:hypothetical protein